MKIIKLRRGFTEIQTIFELIQDYGYIAGGYARYCASPKPIPAGTKDLDIFLKSNDELKVKTLKEKLLELKFQIKYENNLTITFQKSPVGFEEVPAIQIIKPTIIYGTPEEIVNKFDFSVSRACIISPKEVLVDDDFEKDETKSLLVIKHIHCPISSLRRAMKYAKKGYYLKPTEIIRLFADWENRDIEYRNKIKEFFVDSWTPDSKNNSESDSKSKEEIDEIYRMMLID